MMEKQMNCNVNAFDNGIGNEDLDAKKVLAELEAFWKVKVDLKQYGPAIAIKSANKAAVVMAAFQAEVNKQVDQRLGQQRDAGSTHGNGSQKRRGTCFDYGSTTHYKGSPDCPKAVNTPSGPSGPASTPKHGLPLDEAQRIYELGAAKMKEFSKKELIPDGLQLKEGSKVIATFCNKCGKFSKGVTMHHGGIHKGRGWFKSDVPSLGADVPVASSSPVVSANLGAATLNEATLDDIKKDAAKKVGFVGMASGNFCPPCVEPDVSDPSPPPMLSPRSRPPEYDFGSVKTIAATQTVMYDSDLDDDTFLGLLGDMLLKD